MRKMHCRRCRQTVDLAVVNPVFVASRAWMRHQPVERVAQTTDFGDELSMRVQSGSFLSLRFK